ncbi:MAG: NAD(P)H-hydrate dehydratase [Chloroflexota bacterium]|nr:NAD(P)H-hydrate dehydratase [Chloroflexota bacterium]
MYIVTVDEMREIEARAEREYGLTSATLMKNAGESAAAILLETQELQYTPSLAGKHFLFLIGPGNNGGDGHIMAQVLGKLGARVSLYRWKEQQLLLEGKEIPATETATRLQECIEMADYIIDALLGTGRSRLLPENMRDLLHTVQQERQKREDGLIVALDLPTGMNADTGEVDPGTIPADMTITLAYPKQGMFFFPGRKYLGQLAVGDIGLPATMQHNLHAQMITAEMVQAALPPRPLDSNKGTFGKVMLLCGSPPYPGSAYLAGNAAGRIGAGLVTLAVTEKMLPIYASAFHEATFVLLPEESENSFALVKTLAEHLEGYRALLIGPGLGQSTYIREAILEILENLRSLPDEKRPHLLVDADGLNNLSALERWWTLLPPETVITPHPGEMGRLCHGLKVSGGNIDRLELARQKAKEWNVTLVLKGACTIIAKPDEDIRINWQANPALATAGTGDVLAGMISGLLAQKVEPFDAASTAVYLHVAASELVSREIGDTGLLAADLLKQIPRAILEMKEEEELARYIEEDDTGNKIEGDQLNTSQPG